ncbi:uncharacterized protein BDV14DRAFT_182755 [Aspergillus stella-maris]|uniref:uncharacterized protein n=1 Tax=Aspergillus stella-maris TaxID=1810926 RepID=UPI003CCCCB4B
MLPMLLVPLSFPFSLRESISAKPPPTESGSLVQSPNGQTHTVVQRQYFRASPQGSLPDPRKTSERAHTGYGSQYAKRRFHLSPPVLILAPWHLSRSIRCSAWSMSRCENILLIVLFKSSPLGGGTPFSRRNSNEFQRALEAALETVGLKRPASCWTHWNT